MVSEYFLARFTLLLSKFPSNSQSYHLMQYTCNVSLNREKILNSHKIFDFQNLTKLYVTYTICASNVPIFLCWHQLHVLWATTQYQRDHFLQLQWVQCSSKCRKKNHWKSTVLNKANFSSVVTNLWRFG